jgi:hypothetical protein
MQKFYRVCKPETEQGLWYDFKGNFTGLIHNELNFCTNNQLKMDFDPEIQNYLSATQTLEELFQWFSQEDIFELQKRGWFIHIYNVVEHKFYDRFKHYIIDQKSSQIFGKIILNEY